MAIVIRTLYNNQGWKAPCKHPGQDPNCWLCFKRGRSATSPGKADLVCGVSCWEQHLCERFEWGCTPKGKVWGDEVQPGDSVFFVHREPLGGYTLWGLTNVFAAKRQPRTSGEDAQRGFAFLHLDDFAPLPFEKRPRGLTEEQLVGGPWRRGDCKYISLGHAEALEELVEKLHGSG